MSDIVAALLLALAAANAELRKQLVSARDMLMGTAIDAGHLHARIKTVHEECEAWRTEVERLGAMSLRSD